jgi:hypothetical protein
MRYAFANSTHAIEPDLHFRRFTNYLLLPSKKYLFNLLLDTCISRMHLFTHLKKKKKKKSVYSRSSPQENLLMTHEHECTQASGRINERSTPRQHTPADRHSDVASCSV